MAIGSGGPFAQAAARALLDNTDLDARTITEKALGIAADICVYTNQNLTIEELSCWIDRLKSLKCRLLSKYEPLIYLTNKKIANMSEMTPREIVQELDKHIIGQDAAKRAVAIALRNRWRRMQVDEPLRAEITPKNILMIGPYRGRQDRDRAPPGQARQCTVYQGRGHQVHRGRLCWA